MNKDTSAFLSHLLDGLSSLLNGLGLKQLTHFPLQSPIR